MADIARRNSAKKFPRAGDMVTGGSGASIRHRQSHSRLVRRATPASSVLGESPALDAIVVPAGRPAHNLDHAITLARAARCQLVILCSKEARQPEIVDLLAMRSFSATVVQVTPWYTHDFFNFETTDWIRQELSARESDLSIKRNLGLILARMLGWRRIFFMDDDIRDLDTATLHATVSLVNGESPVQQYYTAGMASIDFPDNSVVCHARREIGKFQDVFVSGSALAVNCTVPFAFFPDIYNEDWLFFYRDAVEGRLGTSGHTATQLRYDPFASPQRAADQEFGDVIAEGLYALLEEDLTAEHVTTACWEQFLADRRRMLDEIIGRSASVRNEVREKMLYAVEVARKHLEKIRPQMCTDYIHLWRQDLGRWETKLKLVPRVRSMPEALDQLGLRAAT